jgi:hypothetical protein
MDTAHQVHGVCDCELCRMVTRLTLLDLGDTERLQVQHWAKFLWDTEPQPDTDLAIRTMYDRYFGIY